MSRLKNTRGFTDQFSEKLNLSSEQIQDIDDIEYNLYREYHWSHQQPQPNFKFKFIREVGRILSLKQWLKLKSIRNESKQKIKTKDGDKILKLVRSERERLKGLSLDEKQLTKLANLKFEIPNLIRDERTKYPRRNTDIEELRNRLEKEKYSQILDSEQLSKYNEIIKEEKIKKLNWIIKLSSDRFEHIHKIKLSEDQREDIYLIEDKSPSYNEEGEILSEFEQANYKLKAYKNILNIEQYSLYQIFYQNLIINIKNRISESDRRREIYLERLKRHYTYYSINVLPKTTNARKEIEKNLSAAQKKQIKVLTTEYLKVVQENYNKTKIQFKRFSKDLAVNEMEEFKLRYKLDLISPNGCYLKNYEPAKSFIDVQLEDIIDSKYKELESVFNLLKEYQIEVYEGTRGEYGAGWMTKIFPTKEEERFGKLGLMLLESNYENNLKRTVAIDNT